MACIHGNVALREMDAIVEGVSDKDGERYGLHNTQTPAKTPKQAPQGEQDGQNRDDHREDNPEVVREDHHHQGTEDEGDEDPVERTVHGHCFEVDLHPVLAGLEGRGEYLRALVLLAIAGPGQDLAELSREEVLPFVVVLGAVERGIPLVCGLE